MIINVHMLAFMDGEIREVSIPDDSKEVLRDVFHNGQNDFQPSSTCCSVSVGDVIDLGEQGKALGRYWMVGMVGFQIQTPEVFNAYKNLPREHRRKQAWVK